MGLARLFPSNIGVVLSGEHLMIRSLIDFLLVAALALGASACAGSGGGSPIDPGPGGSPGPGAGSGAVISGTVIGRQSSGQTAAATLDGAPALTVTVNGTNLTVTVSASGHFEISDVPPGNVELVFRDGSSSWIVVLMDVAAGQQIQIQVNLSSGIPTIVSQSRSTSSAATEKVRLCHKTESGRYQSIEISVSAEATHRGHGDAAVGEAVPADPTKVFDANCQAVVPSIRIVKSTNGDDANEAPGPSIKVGNTVTWTYVVTNNSLVPLTNVLVTDDRGVAVNCGGITMLAAGASMTCTGMGVAAAGQYRNIGTATASDPAGATVTHSDPSHYFGEVDEGGPSGPKVTLCHKKGKGRYQLITVGAPAEPAHRAHGDAKPGEPVPNETGKTFAADCTF
jgi:hypothetical protein